MKYRIIALDVDGTLLEDDHRLSPRVRAAVRAAAERGAEIVICTGRGSTSALPVLAELGLSGTMITHNGASIVDSATREVIDETRIDESLALRYLDYCRERGHHIDMNTAFDLYVDRVTDEMIRLYAPFHMEPNEWSDKRRIPEGTVKMTVTADKEALDRIHADWETWEAGLQIVRSGDYFLDVQPADASKGEALRRFAAIRGVPRERVLAIGNYYNDIGMLEFAGRSVAMGNSPDGVKAVADEVTVTNNEDGVAVVLERLLDERE